MTTFNYDPTNINQGAGAPRAQLFQGGSASGEPVDGWTNGELNGTPRIKASYQDELTVGIEKSLDPTLSIGLKGTYRTLGRTIEDRCDLDGNVAPSTCALFNPGGDGQAASGEFPTCNGSANPTDPTAGQCSPSGVAVGDAKRIFRGIEMVARKQFTNEIWAQASFLYSSLKGNYSGAIREVTGQTDPGINADYDYYQFTFNGYGNLELDRPVQARIDAVYNAPFGLSAGAQFYVRSGLPMTRYGFFNNFYPTDLFLDTRGTFDRTPTDYDLNLSLAYNLAVGPVTITPQIYLFNVLNNQTISAFDTNFNTAGSFVTDTTSPFYGQAGSGAGRRDVLRGGHVSVPRQSGLPEVDDSEQPAAPARGDQGDFLGKRSVHFRGRFRPPPVSSFRSSSSRTRTPIQSDSPVFVQDEGRISRLRRSANDLDIGTL